MSKINDAKAGVQDVTLLGWQTDEGSGRPPLS